MNSKSNQNLPADFRWPIKKKLTWLITFVALISVLLGGVAVVVQDISQAEDKFAEKITLIAEMVGNYSAVDIEFDDKKAATESIGKLDDIPAILNAHLYDKKGHKFVSLKSDEFESDFRLSLEIQQVVIDNKFVVTTPIKFDGKFFGYIQLVASTKEIGENIKSGLITTTILGLILSLFVYALAYWLQGIISRPILSLALTAKGISEASNYSTRVEHNTQDEIGLLYHSFNKMLDTVEDEQQQTRNALQDLKNSEARFSAMFQSIPDAVMFADTERLIRLNNPAVFELFQYTDNELIGKTTEILYPTHEAYVEQGKIRYNKNSIGMDLPYEVQYKRKDGSIVWTESLGTKVITSTGEHIGFLGIFRDVTDRKIAEEKLIRQQQEQLQILDTMVDAVISVDAQGIIASFNRGAELMFGYYTNDVLGKNVKILMPAEYANHHDNFIQNYIETGEAKIIGIGREVAGLRQSGEQFPMRLAVAELPNDDAGGRRFIGTCHDISREKQQDEILQRSQKMDALGKLTGGVAHDFNNMLGVILGYSQLLLTRFTEDSKEHKYINEIEKAGVRAKDLTSKLLSFSRNRAINLENADVNQLLNDAKLMLEKTLTARISLTLDLATNIWPILIDKSGFVDAILNMSINAMHVMQYGGSLTLTTQNISLSVTDAKLLSLVPGGYVKVSVSDTGVGMTKEIQDRLFEPFFTTKGENGTGLGLSQVYGFVSQSNGTIQVFSKPGLGSRFDLYFPENTHKQSQISEKKSVEIKKTEIAANILVVDDEPALVNLAEDILQSNGFIVFTASNAEDALKILKEKPIDILLTDVIMPKMDGYALASRVREDFPNIRVQIISGYHDGSHSMVIDETLRQEALVKPYRAQDLLEKIHNIAEDLPHHKNRKLKILVVDDEENIQKLMELSIRKLGHEVFSTYTGNEAINIYQKYYQEGVAIDLVFVDLNIVPGIDGLEVAKQILMINPQANLIVSSGDSESEIMENCEKYGFKAAMSKNISAKNIAQIISKLI